MATSRTAREQLTGEGTTAFQNLQFLENCEEFGIEPGRNPLIGFPCEDPSVHRTYTEELRDLVHLAPRHGGSGPPTAWCTRCTRCTTGNIERLGWLPPTEGESPPPATRLPELPRNYLDHRETPRPKPCQQHGRARAFWPDACTRAFPPACRPVGKHA
ncbi:hypothetical protein GCM10010269_60340 [Streptomyces humidus]|uniref:Uncharacterized protein n=1 Tax=Streptomyces humidus TaxID=52259 RepID=A0A918G187_9ACTN|nr:hypothetical protein GCM10010269_60340 [Streptomyces humidus]